MVFVEANYNCATVGEEHGKVYALDENTEHSDF
jgi:hypothetical protein